MLLTAAELALSVRMVSALEPRAPACVRHHLVSPHHTTPCACTAELPAAPLTFTARRARAAADLPMLRRHRLVRITQMGAVPGLLGRDEASRSALM